MYVEMNCRCNAVFQIDSDEEDSVWPLVWRFTASHVSCGYVTSGTSAEGEKAQRLITRPGSSNE